MTISSHTKLLKQVRAKAAAYGRYLRFNRPKERTFGRGTKECQRCGNHRAHIGKYGLNLCRRCFRHIATKIGFKKYN